MRKGSAARALSEQSLRQLGSVDPERRAQAARNLAAVPEPAAAPDLAAALSRERDPRVRGALAIALVACGAEGAADLVAGLQGPSEPAVVRLAALDALCSAGHERALSALEVFEAGKNWQEADADVAEAIDFCNFYAVVMRDLGHPQRTQTVAGESNLQHWWPRGVGVIKLELHVFPHNEPAIRLYERFGFEREGFRRGHFRNGGQLIDAILMAYEVPH